MTLPFEPAAELASKLLHDHVVSRIWQRDVSVWDAEPGSPAAKSIASRLGWLDIATTMRPHLDRLAALGHAAREEGIREVYLLGMGGSSLCAEVLRSVYGVTPGSPELFVLDTTDERSITQAAARIDPERTWVVVASKSGGTVEVASMERFFWQRLSAARGNKAGRQFIAVTDPGTALEQLAAARGYRDAFINPADIGGRFSALSLFGLVPTALIGAPAHDLLAAGTAMADGCRQENHANAGFELGAFIAATAIAGRDKLTVVLPESLSMLGLWIEQLIAESTGKLGKGALPIVDEPLGRPDEYGQDRAFVAIATERDAPDKVAMSALHAAGHPILSLTTRLDGLGAEFFRWEFATAVAGAALHINPFDEPNVAEAKAKTAELLTTFAAQHRLEEAAPLIESDEVAVSTRGFAGDSPAALVRAALTEVKPGDYVALPLIPAARLGHRQRDRGDPSGNQAQDPCGHHLRHRATLPAFDRAVSQGRSEHRAHLPDHVGRRDRDRDSGGRVFVRRAEAGAGARRLRDTRKARPPRREAAHQARRRWRGAGALVCGGAPVGHQIPSSKLQIPTTSQLPSAKPNSQLEVRLGSWELGVPWSLGFGAWELIYRSASVASTLPDSTSTSLCRLLPCASMVTIAGKSRTCRCHIASGVPNSVSDTPSTRSMQRA